MKDNYYNQKEAAKLIGVSSSALRQEFLNPPRKYGKYHEDDVDFIIDRRSKIQKLGRLITGIQDKLNTLRNQKAALRSELTDPDCYPSNLHKS
jgi:predicted transcriptional regulator